MVVTTKQLKVMIECDNDNVHVINPKIIELLHQSWNFDVVFKVLLFANTVFI